MEALLAMEQLTASMADGMGRTVLGSLPWKPTSACLPRCTRAVIAALEEGEHHGGADGDDGGFLHQPGAIMLPFGADAHFAGNVGDVAAEERSSTSPSTMLIRSAASRISQCRQSDSL